MNIKKQLLGAAMATAIGAAAIGGGTYALFTDSAANAGNTFTAGTVEISDITNGNGSAAFSLTDLAPGDTGSKTITIHNDGSLNAWVKLSGVSATSGDLFTGSHPVGVTLNVDAELIPAGQSKDFTVNYNFPLAAGNEYQGATGEFTVDVKAVQSKNNGDSGNNGVVDSGDAPMSWNENATP